LYLKKRDIHLTLNRGDILAEITPPPWMEQLRQAALAACRTILRSGTSDPEAPGNVLASMLLGDRSLLTEERVQRYRRTGTYHLFAVSGLHVGSAAACLHWLCGLARLSPKTRLLPVLLGTWSYVWLTGGSPSAIRAGIMISCLGLARQLLRQPHLFPALVLSAWMVLLWQPAQLFDLGFQLSYCVVGAIILIGLPVVAEFRNRLERRTPQNSREHPVRHLVTNGLSRTAELACISLGAGLGSMPLIIQHFHLFTPVGVMLGVILNPLASLCVMAGCISMLASPLFGIAMAGLLAKITWPAIRLMEFLLDASLQIPGAVSERSWIWPPAGILVTLSVLALAWFLQHLRQGGRRLHTAFLLLPHAAIAASLIFTTLNA
jgi:competence protein ComEC